MNRAIDAILNETDDSPATNNAISNLSTLSKDPECLAMFRKLIGTKPGQRHLTLQATKYLLTKYPDLTSVVYSELGGKILDIAFHNGYSLPVLHYILQKTPEKSITVRAPSSLKSDRLLLLTEHLLPNLTQLGWRSNSMKALTVLKDCLAKNHSITHLRLELRTTNASSNTGETIGDAIQSILAADRLESLSIETISSLDIDPICQALQTNRNLHSLDLDPPLSELKPMNKLLAVLEDQNVGLYNVSIDKRLQKYASHKKIVYYLLLNECGRASARDPQTPMDEFVQLLEATEAKGKMYQFRLLYGLLRETPSLWCTKCEVVHSVRVARETGC